MSVTSPEADITAIEAAKENVLPLHTGRSAAKLTGLLARDRKSLDSELKQGHDKFQAEIAVVEADPENCDDALDVYHRYIRWTLSSYPSGPSHASHLVPLLEQTTRRFIHTKQYQQDVRYLRLWILYAKYVDCPRDIFRFLEANDLGTSAAAFYEEWAAVEENSRRYKEADAILSLGVHRKAEPLNRLKKRRSAFQARLVALPDANKDEERSPSPPIIRPALGASSSGARSLEPSQGGGLGSVVPKPNGAAFAVFTGDAADEPEARLGSWEDVGTRDGRRRENHMEGTKWKGETLPMHAKAPSERLEVFRDEDATPLSSAGSASNDAFKPLRGPSEAEYLRKNPFKYYDSADVSLPSDASKDSALSVLAQVKTASSSSKASLGATKTSKTKATKPAAASATTASASSAVKKERVASPLSEVYPEDELGRAEYSFEEILAIRRGIRSRGSAKPPAVISQPEWVIHAAGSGDWFHVDQQGQAVLVDPATGEGAFEYVRDRQKAERLEAERLMEEQRQHARQALEAQHRSEDRPRPQSPELIQTHRPPSPTINTKAAMAEVDDMFGATMAYDISARSSRSSRSSASGIEIVETDDDATESEDEGPVLPSQASQPGDFINNSFWGPVQSQASQPSQAAPQRDGSRSRLLDEGDVEDGSTTEEDEEDNEPTPPATQNRQHGKAPSSLAAKRLFRPTPPTEASDENADPRPRLPSAKRAPLGAKVLGPKATSPTEGEIEKPKALSTELQVFQDNNEADSSQPAQGFEMGRRPLGEGSRFAPMVDMMTPIVERTLEYAPMTFNGGLTGDIRGVPCLVEEEEPSDSEEAADVNAAFDEARRRKASLASSLASVREGMDEDEDKDEALVLPPSAQTTQPVPCHPFEAQTLALALQRLPDIRSRAGYYDLTATKVNHLASLQKNAKSRNRKSASQDEEGLLLDLAKQTFSVREKLGEGGFGAVFRVANAGEWTEDEDQRPNVFALKVQRPATAWEFQLIHQLRDRLAPDMRALQSIVKPFDLFDFADESHLLLEVCDQGTLLELVNAAPTHSLSPSGGAPGLEEMLAMFFVVELSRTLEAMHSSGFIHGDFKIENCLVRLDEVVGGPRVWVAQYKADGSSGWAHKGVKVIDFGRTIDRTTYPPAQRFLADWDADVRDCLEIRTGESWTVEPDYHGLAGIAFTLLFGKHFTSEHTTPLDTGLGSALKGKPFRRYHQVELWTRFFTLLLAPRAVRSDKSLPITDELSAVRRDMQVWLEAHADKGAKNLRSLLKKVEIAQLSRARG